MTGRIAAVALLLAALAAPPAHAQPIDLSSGGPVDVTARDGFEWHENDQTVIANGDARAVRGNVTVLADRLVAHYRKKAAPRRRGGRCGSRRGRPATSIPAATRSTCWTRSGHVRIVTPTDEAVGDKAVYDIDQARAGDDRPRPEADHAAICHDRARQHGILVAAAHGGGPRQRRGGGHRRPPALGRRAGGLHHRGHAGGAPAAAARNGGSRRRPSPRRRLRPAAASTPRASCSASKRSATSRCAPRPTPCGATAASMCPTPAWRESLGHVRIIHGQNVITGPRRT